MISIQQLYSLKNLCTKESLKPELGELLSSISFHLETENSNAHCVGINTHSKIEMQSVHALDIYRGS